MTGTVVTVGSFDGLHRGHQAVIAEIVRRARERGLESLVVTFEPHPLEVVNPGAAPRLLSTAAEKRALLAETDADRVAVLEFTPELARLAPEEFVREILRDRFELAELVLGHDHGFGRGRSGDLETVRRLGEADGFRVDAVAPVLDERGQAISSTLVRTAVAHGNLDAAAGWLGRRYSVTAEVQRGAGRGRTIGVPTANLAPADPRKLLPPDGVYAVWVKGAGRGKGEEGRVGGMMNQGPRPTFGVEARGLEVHLFDFDGDLYGRTITVEWVRRLREVRTFPSREALVEQLAEDARSAEASLKLQEAP
ncbi:MAG TPA: bifunctional riboflavin kinase/FAD synthetase [Gemmatimonadales bacterium]|nr:bifunctional riboflavin kinase/FAD synthetase [Gemmatimonadales bacterium]